MRGGAEDNLIRGMTLTLASRLCRLANRWLNVAICTEISHKLLINANGPFMWNVHKIKYKEMTRGSLEKILKSRNSVTTHCGYRVSACCLLLQVGEDVASIIAKL